MDQGLLLVNKPIGYSTFDIIRDFKRATSFSGKVGHAGTLDVFACGLVILLINTTKQFAQFQDLTKHYQASLRLGIDSSTLDIEGELTAQDSKNKPSKDQLNELLYHFVGTYNQAVPAYSAAKFKGQPLYKHALKGDLIISKSKEVTIHSINLLAYKYPLITLDVACSSGTYVRQLTYDIFAKLDIKSFLFNLTRTQIGDYLLKDALNVNDLSNWQTNLVSITL